MRLRVTFATLLIASIVLASIAVAGSLWVVRVTSKYAKVEYRSLLKDVVDSFDRDIAGHHSYAVQLGGSRWVEQIAYMQGDSVDPSRITILQLQDYATEMKLYAQSSGVYSAGLVFMDKDLVLSNSAKCDLTFLSGSALRVDGMSEQDWMAACRRAAKGESVIFPNVTMHQFVNTFDGMLMMFQVYTKSKPDACVLFVALRHRDFLSYFDNLLGRGDSLSISVAQQGEEPFLTRGGEVEDAQTLTQVSEQTGLVFTMRVPKQLVLSDVIKSRNTLLWIVAGLWLLIMVFAPFATKHLFRPLDQLMNLVVGETPLRRDINEFDALKSGIEQIKRQEEAMTRELSMRSVYLRNAELERLLNDMPPEEGQGERLSEFVREFAQYKAFRIAVAHWRNGQSAATLPSWAALEEKLRTVPGTKTAVLRKPGRHILITAYDEKKDFENLITLLLESWEDCYVAIGSEENSLSALHVSLQAAEEANNFRTVSEGFRVLNCDNVQKNIRYYLPQNSETQLLSFVSAGQGDRAAALFEELYDCNKDEKGTTFVGMENFLSSVNLSVLKCAPDKTAFAMPAFGDDLENARETVRENILLAAQFSAQRQQEMPTRMENILSFVTANLVDPTLSLDMVADHFSVSTSLISRLFTEQYGENFHAFVNRQRIALATEAMSAGKYDINHIAQQVGYTNDATFRRMFKRFVGMTPSAYRTETNGK